MKEIEVKLKYKDKEKVVEKLKNMGAKFREKYLLEDHYFSLTGNDMSNTNELLRIRKKGDKQELTFKGKCETEGNIWERVEINTDIGDSEALLKIFEHLKLNQLSTNKSFREFWDLGNAEIAFTDITYPAEIKFMEIEASADKINKILKELNDLVSEAGEEIFKKLDEAWKNKK